MTPPIGGRRPARPTFLAPALGTALALLAVLLLFAAIGVELRAEVVAWFGGVR